MYHITVSVGLQLPRRHLMKCEDGFDAQPTHLPQTPAGRAATIARGVMIFRQKLKQGLVKPDATKEGPLCMDTYR